MRILKLLPLLLLFLFSTCKTTPPLISFFVNDGVIQHFLSPTRWTSVSKNSEAKPDVTYRTGVDTPAAVNISFYGNKAIPRNVRDVSLQGAGIECPLNLISVLFVNPDKYELRISFSADRDKFVDIMKTQRITLNAVVDGVSYVYTPEKNFYKLKDKFLASIFIY